MSVRAVLFDFDLTLADSSAAIIACTEYALHRLDAAAATPAQIGAVIGLPLHEMFRSLTGETEPARADAFARHFVARADEIMVHGTRIYPEVPSLLARLREQGLAVAIVSSKFRYRIEAILALNELQSLVDVLIGGEDVQRHKPDPEGLVLALARLGVPARSAIYVGDHAVDAQAAERAGVAFVGAVSGMTSFDGWARAGKQAVATHIGELDAIVQRMGRDPSEASG
ncbi:HAD family hydrolase [Burkholderia aenigmatica]|uniref:HAD family hydrolase n=1 Tax=Burkholderia TaxID=32008 RepID=UPI000F07E0A3|nr:MULTISPECIES: HAD-IA family hydrolase [Burkholderia]AYQ41082.1 HAD family hydrolase [Burkholderia lata]MCA8293426.1 HAD-IA family hydrolase [Burkholderia sp. AU30198]VWC83515.1 HAD family hydrolase [Burkholderia aenigmatica]